MEVVGNGSEVIARGWLIGVAVASLVEGGDRCVRGEKGCD